MSDENILSEIATRPAEASPTSLAETRVTAPSVVSISLCFVTFVSEFAMMLLTTSNPWSLGPADALIFGYMLGPVVVLSFIAWGTRTTRRNAWVRSLVIVAILGWGLWTVLPLKELEFSLR